MGWFGGGSSKTDTSSSSSATASDFSLEEGSFGTTNFASSGSSSLMSTSGGSAVAELQQFSVALQQQMLVQAVITDLCDASFARCIQGKPGDSLGGREVACVHATVGKWLDTNEFMMGRMAKKQGAAGGSFS